VFFFRFLVSLCIVYGQMGGQTQGRGPTERQEVLLNFACFPFSCCLLGGSGTRLMLLVVLLALCQGKEKSKRVVYTLGSKTKRVNERFSTESKTKKSKAWFVNTESKQKRVCGGFNTE